MTTSGATTHPGVRLGGSTLYPSILRCPRCGHVERRDIPYLQGYKEAKTLNKWGTVVPLARPCPRCQQTTDPQIWRHFPVFLDITRIIGESNPDAPCDIRCQEAVGPLCVCSCGGAQHSIAWLGVGA